MKNNVKKNIKSFNVTTICNHLDIYGQRLILRLVEFATEEGAVEGLNFKSGKDIRKIEVDACGGRLVTIPLTDLIGDSENYAEVQSSILALQNETIEFKEEDGACVYIPILRNMQMDRGKLTVNVDGLLWKVLQGDLALQ